MAVTFGPQVVFGAHLEKPLAGFPPGKIRLRMRSTEFLQAFVRNADGIQHFYVGDDGNHWVPRFKIGENRNAKQDDIIPS